MIPHVDWLTFTTTTGIKTSPALPSSLYPKSEAVKDALSALPSSFVSLLEFEMVRPRRPHEWAMQCTSTNTRISGRFSSPNVTVEVTGMGCDILAKTGQLTALAIGLAEKLSRIDIAVDVKTSLKPPDVAQTFKNKNWKTRSEITSPKGHTCYIGAWSGDRFARVYRYNPPTPRWEYLRFEFVFKRRHARIVADYLGVGGWSKLLSAIGDIYGIKHKVWRDGVKTVPGSSSLISWVRERKITNTLHWLQTVAMPSVVRLVEDGQIDDIDDWLRTNVHDKIATRSE